MRHLCTPLFVSALLIASSSTAIAADVVVNNVRLENTVRQALERSYKVPIQSGRYWYDPVSGAWGLEGGPVAGQIHPGLRLGGPLRADASKGTTGVFVNGRQLHALDVASLQRCVPVVPGRYWVLANGVGGHEGGPATFNLAVPCGGQRAGGGSGTQCQDYGNGQFNCNNSRTGIGVIGEGGGKAGVFIDGKVISTPN